MRDWYRPVHGSFPFLARALGSNTQEAWTGATFKKKYARLLTILTFALVVILLFLLTSRLELPTRLGLEVPEPILQAAAEAAGIMESALEAVRKAKETAGLEIPPGSRGLVGEAYNDLTTTLGSLSAKMTAENSAWASVLTKELWREGLSRGDFVALGMSGSFPGLNLAFICAAQALGLKVAAVSSVTASTYGANQEGFTWPEIEVLLAGFGIIQPVTKGISLGGEEDRAEDLQLEGQEAALSIAVKSAKVLGAENIGSHGLTVSVDERLALYKKESGASRISLYVNIGGTLASMGQGDAALELSSGFLEPRSFDLGKQRGVMARMMEEGIPVLSLLNVKDLALKWGIPLE